MSNHLALATVTASISMVLQTAISADVPGAEVKTAQPNEGGVGLPKVGVNLFLYNVAHNAALRNADLPTRRSNGKLVQPPGVALDLHYLLTFYGDEPSLESQRILGSAVRALHASPLLSRNVIQKAIAANGSLAGSDLADAIQSVRLVPTALSLEELSKLWSVFFLIPYTLSVAYQASVVVIEPSDSPEPTLPVLERTLNVLPFRSPRIRAVDPARTISQGGVTLRGENLAGDATSVRIGNQSISPNSVSTRNVYFTVPATLGAGVHSVQVIHELELGSPPTLHRGFESNGMPIVVLPAITTPQPISVAAGATLTLDLSLPVGLKQRAFVLIGDHEFGRAVATEEPEKTKQLDFEIPDDMAAGNYLLRVRIDGAESELTTDAVTGKFDGPTVTIT